MASSPILPWFGRLTQLVRPGQTAERPDLHTLGAHPGALAHVCAGIGSGPALP